MESIRAPLKSGLCPGIEEFSNLDEDTVILLGHGESITTDRVNNFILAAECDVQRGNAVGPIISQVPRHVVVGPMFG